MRILHSASLPVAGILILLASCSDKKSPTRPAPGVPVASLTITPEQPSALIGEQVRLTVAARDAQGNAVPNPTIQWSSSHPAVAEVAATGDVSARGFGEARITALSGSASATAVITVRHPPRDSVAVLAADSTRLVAGNRSSVTLPAGIFPTGTQAVVEETTNVAAATDGQPLGPGVRLRLHLPSRPAAASLAPYPEGPHAAATEVRQVAVRIRVPPTGGTPPGTENFWASVRDERTGDHTVVRASEAREVAGELGTRSVELAFLFPMYMGLDRGSGAMHDLRISPMQATYVCADASWQLNPAGQGPNWQGPSNPDRIPLILVHGWQKDDRTCEASDSYFPDRNADGPWTPWLAELAANPRFEVWVFRYPTFYSVTQSALRLKNAIASRFANREVVLVGHSMGGLVSATYMVNFPAQEHVRELVTLGTPFWGSPLAVHMTSDIDILNAHGSCTFGLGTIADVFFFGDDLNTAGAYDLVPGAPVQAELDKHANAFSGRLRSYAGVKAAWGAVDIPAHGRNYPFTGCILSDGKKGPNDGVVTETSALRHAPAGRRISLPNLDHSQIASHPLVRTSVLARLRELGTEMHTAARAMHIATGNEQRAAPGALLPAPLVVRVVDAAGVGVPGTQVSFSVTAGGGTVEPASALTDARGEARAAWRLGVAAGEQTLAAASAGLANSPLQFRATAGDVRLLPRATITTATDHTCATTSAGAAYCWGSDNRGNLGNEPGASSGKPYPVFGGRTYVMLAAAGDGAEFAHTAFTCGITTSAAAFCWGSNDYGELGSPTFTCGFQKQGACTPAEVAGGHRFVHVAAGNLHACAIDEDNVAFCWGYNGFGALGVGPDRGGNYFTPQAVAGSLRFTQLTASRMYTCGLTVAGVVYCWGNGSTSPRVSQAGRVFTAVTAGGDHVCALDGDGAAFCWGNNAYGQLGNGSSAGSSTEAVPVAGNLRFTEIDAGAEHTCAITAQGRAYCWGQGSSGQLGHGAFEGSRVPVEVVGPPPFSTISAGTGYSCAVTRTGPMYCWGHNLASKLGNESTAPSAVPVRVLDPVQLPASRAGRSRSR